MDDSAGTAPALKPPSRLEPWIIVVVVVVVICCACAGLAGLLFAFGPELLHELGLVAIPISVGIFS